MHVSACLRGVKRATPARDAKANENAEDLPMREWPPPPKPRTAGKESAGERGNSFLNCLNTSVPT